MSRGARTVRAARFVADLTTAPVRRERMLLALDTLPETERLVLALDLCDGLAVAEIAETLELTPRRVARTRDRALTQLRRALAGAPLPMPADGDADLRSAM